MVTKQRWCVKERAKAYTLEEGLLHHRPSGGKLCIPKSLRSDVIREAHDAILGGGHISTATTSAAVGSRYHWLKITDSITEWITGCNICRCVNHKNARPYRLLQALPIPLERAERMNINFVSKLPMCQDPPLTTPCCSIGNVGLVHSGQVRSHTSDVLTCCS